MLIARLATIVVLSLIDRGFRISPDILQRFPALKPAPTVICRCCAKSSRLSLPSSASLQLLEVWGVDAVVWFYGGQIGSRCCRR